ncbi:MAG: hypothetical protein WCC01_09765 [Acidimicrobiia bacterium]
MTWRHAPSAMAARAAQYPHMPWTPASGGVADEHVVRHDLDRPLIPQ